MTREEKCILAKEKGYIYDPETGVITSPLGIIKSITSNGYIKINITKRYALFGHQYAWWIIHNECPDRLDHINRIKTDNRICNLRKISNRDNYFNSRVYDESRGYYFDKSRDKWMAQIKVYHKNINLGRYDTEEEARQAYLNAKEKYHKILSFPTVPNILE